MQEFSPWVWDIISKATVAGAAAMFTWIAARRMYGATASEKEANAARTLGALCGDLSTQLRTAEELIETGKKKMGQIEIERDTHAKMCHRLEDSLTSSEKENDRLRGLLADVEQREPLGFVVARMIREEAMNIAEQASHLSYLADPDEGESVVAQRFRSMKASAAKIAALEILKQ
jgi:hypothetical protein